MYVFAVLWVVIMLFFIKICQSCVKNAHVVSSLSYNIFLALLKLALTVIRLNSKTVKFFTYVVYDVTRFTMNILGTLERIRRMQFRGV
jgi:hypothetical protein